MGLDKITWQNNHPFNFVTQLKHQISSLQIEHSMIKRADPVQSFVNSMDNPDSQFAEHQIKFSLEPHLTLEKFKNRRN